MAFTGYTIPSSKDGPSHIEVSLRDKVEGIGERVLLNQDDDIVYLSAEQVDDLIRGLQELRKGME